MYISENVMFNHKKVLLTSPLSSIIPMINLVGHSCNLKCRYCFFYKENQNTRNIMSDELLENFIKQYAEIFREGPCTFIWHGGEPLLAGINKFYKIVEFQEKYCKNQLLIKNTIQTNGTLITQEWAKFLKSFNFGIGISIDGPPLIHNLNRKFPNGKDSFNEVLKGINILKSEGMKFGVIVTITKSNAYHIREILDYFTEDLGINKIAFNFYLPEEQLNINDISDVLSKNGIDNNIRFDVLKSAFSWLIKKNNSNVEIREVTDYLLGCLGKYGLSCRRNGTCSDYVCVDYDGKITACTRLSKFTYFGNLYESPLLDIFNDPRRTQFATSIKKYPEECMSCKWLSVCRNGCTYHRRPIISGKNFYCESTKNFYEFLELHVSCLLRELHKH